MERPAACCGHVLLDAVEDHFGRGWASEVGVTLGRTPPTVVAAYRVESGEPMGFCAWDAAALGFLGPVGVFGPFRKSGVGRVLVLECLHRMRAQGYGYAIVGGAGPGDFFRRVCDARPIAGSEAGIYPQWLFRGESTH